jgi:hypothetical protein
VLLLIKLLLQGTNLVCKAYLFSPGQEHLSKIEYNLELQWVICVKVIIKLETMGTRSDVKSEALHNNSLVQLIGCSAGMQLLKASFNPVSPCILVNHYLRRVIRVE